MFSGMLQPRLIPERTDQARNRIIGANIETEHLRDGTGDQPASASGGAKSTNQTPCS